MRRWTRSNSTVCIVHAQVMNRISKIIRRVLRRNGAVDAATGDALPGTHKRGLRLLLGGAGIIVALGVAVAAFGYFTSHGSGSGAATTGTLNSPSAVSVPATNNTGNVSVSWTAPAGGVTPLGYYVTRTPYPSGTSSNACGTNPNTPTYATSPCTDSAVPEGKYTYTVTAVYNSWSAVSASSSVVNVDMTSPTSVFAFPSASAYNAAGWTAGCSTPGICGTASDPGATASGVSTVQVSIQRGSDSKYWNGAAWVSSGTTVWDTASTSNGWANWTFPLSGSNLTSGTSYTVQSQATDLAGNVQTTPASRSFIYDTTPPNVTLQTAAGEYSSSGTSYDGEATWTSGTIAGTATDTGGSGVSDVNVSVQQVGGSCWTGSGSNFTAACPNYVIANSANSWATWSLNFSTSDLPDGGAYAITAVSTDGAGNSSATASQTVDIDYNPATTIFVSSSGSDSNTGKVATSGLPTPSPVATLTQALTLTNTTYDVIAISGGSYSNTVTIAGAATNVTLRGGYSSSSWLRSSPGGNAATITGTTTAGAANSASMVGVYVPSGYSPELEQLTINSGTLPSSSPSTSPGSAYAVLADSSGTATITNSVIQAQAGQPGAAGTAGAGPASAGCTGKHDDRTEWRWSMHGFERHHGRRRRRRWWCQRIWHWLERYVRDGRFG